MHEVMTWLIENKQAVVTAAFAAVAVAVFLTQDDGPPPTASA
ncbi:hypothetical protein [Pseudomonas phage PJNP013]|uniref:Uncharacterized protein n=1 Tax=Pseudomonas phage PJNP013 TaxID=3108093 RepID=A0ABZ2CRY7_9CAUD